MATVMSVRKFSKFSLKNLVVPCAVVLLLTSLATADPISIQSLEKQFKVAVPSPTWLTNTIPLGTSLIMGVPWCMATAPMVYQVIIKKTLTLQEAHETFAGCVIPIIGPWIVRGIWKNHPDWKKYE